MVDDVVDKYGEIKDNASPDLLNIRRGMNSIRGKSELWNPFDTLQFIRVSR
jgi:hypothetical protein